MYLEFARWVVIVTSAIAILIGMIGLEESGFLGITVILRWCTFLFHWV